MNNSQLKKIGVPLAIGCGVVVCLAALAAGLVVGNQYSQKNAEATVNAFSTALQSTQVANAAISTAGAAATATVKAIPATAGPAPTLFPTLTPDPAIAAATEAAVAPIRQALPTYGLDPNQGRFGYIFQNQTIELEKFHAAEYSKDYLALPVTDFVVQADVTWETRTGLAGCGFVFRADQSESYYGMGIARGAEGVAVFVKVINGGGINDWRTEDAPATRWRNGDTNTLAVVAQGDQFRLFVNGELSEVIGDSDLQAGIVALAALSESGTSRCTFSNGWLWVLD